jgi:hypothetical protein
VGVVEKTQLQGHFSEVPFSEFDPSSFLGTLAVEDCRPSKSILFLGLGLMASGRRGLPIEEVVDCHKFRRAQWKALKEAGRLNTAANCLNEGNVANGLSGTVMKMTKAIEQIFA